MLGCRTDLFRPGRLVRVLHGVRAVLNRGRCRGYIYIYTWSRLLKALETGAGIISKSILVDNLNYVLLHGMLENADARSRQIVQTLRLTGYPGGKELASTRSPASFSISSAVASWSGDRGRAISPVRADSRIPNGEISFMKESILVGFAELGKRSITEQSMFRKWRLTSQQYSCLY